MDIHLKRQDFSRPFTDPRSCPFACALKRAGFSKVVVGTLGAEVTVDGEPVNVWVSGVYLNGEKIDNPCMGFGPVEYNLVRQAFARDSNTVAIISLTNLN